MRLTGKKNPLPCSATKTTSFQYFHIGNRVGHAKGVDAGSPLELRIVVIFLSSRAAVLCFNG